MSERHMKTRALHMRSCCVRPGVCVICICDPPLFTRYVSVMGEWVCAYVN